MRMLVRILVARPALKSILDAKSFEVHNVHEILPKPPIEIRQQKRYNEIYLDISRIYLDISRYIFLTVLFLMGV